MIKKIIKSFLVRIKVYPFLVFIQKKYFPNQGDKKLEKQKERFFAFYSKFVNEGDLCFDVGAHMGSRVDVLLKCKARIVAIEPYKPCYDYLKLKYNNKIFLINKGVGSKKEMRKMYISDDPTTNTFSSDWVGKVSENRFKGRSWKKETEMEMVSLDDLIDQYGQPSFCKIDVEGFEYEVLSGLSKVINTLSFEYTVPEDIASTKKCLEKINSLNSDYKYNYSIGESMVLALPAFLSYEDFSKELENANFLNSGCGDIYVSLLPLKFI
ncbi:MAG: FkbM family methyltransferase [Cytophagaceae bacterium]